MGEQNGIVLMNTICKFDWPCTWRGRRIKRSIKMLFDFFPRVSSEHSLDFRRAAVNASKKFCARDKQVFAIWKVKFDQVRSLLSVQWQIVIIMKGGVEAASCFA
ncbi:MAG TPA: hypothetical protein DD373_05450 [Halomonas sp.]|nr:hypothetical protein [Halomonas sp.]HBM43145.1 hypothetical protein [Halomonas sp.]